MGTCYRNYTGLVRGYWTVEQRVGHDPTTHRQLYLCRDIFGARRVFNSSQLIRRTFGRHLYDAESIHKRRLLDANYRAMIHRCYNPQNPEYSSYGGRGIRITKTWLGKVGRQAFIFWAVLSGWKKGLTIDRIDVNGHYSPENCRFIERAENARYRRSARLSYEIAVSLREEFKQWTGSVEVFCREHATCFGVRPTTIRAMLRNESWS